MLESVKQERSRHFKLALRVGIPLLLLVFLLSYAVFFNEDVPVMSPGNFSIMAALVFVTIYFIYFALELGRKETLLDQITEGYNFASFLDRAKKMRSRTLAVIQIGNLFTINENYGVRFTDTILQTLVVKLHTEMLSRLDGKTGCLGRKYGAEFLIAVDVSALELEKALKEFSDENSNINGVDVEFNFAVIENNDGMDPEIVVNQLRDIIVSRKNRGHDNTGSQKNIIIDSKKYSNEENRVLEALENELVFFTFRPLLNLKSERVDIYEIAVKLRGNDGREIAPRDFLPIINRHGFGVQYDRYIFTHVTQLAKLIDSDISLSFNLSPFSMRQREFRQDIVSILEESKISPERLIIELYERRTHHKLGDYLKILTQLKSDGLRFCLDNFGSSNASMEYIRHFPFDMIHFDRDYMRNLDDEKNFSILGSLIEMAHGLGVKTAAKWVDNQDNVEKLRRLGVDYIQGYAAGRVMNENQLIEKYNPIESR